jgi:hypothetical protein
LTCEVFSEFNFHISSSVSGFLYPNMIVRVPHQNVKSDKNEAEALGHSYGEINTLKIFDYHINWIHFHTFVSFRLSI